MNIFHAGKSSLSKKGNLRKNRELGLLIRKWWRSCKIGLFDCLTNRKGHTPFHHGAIVVVDSLRSDHMKLGQGG